MNAKMPMENEQLNSYCVSQIGRNISIEDVFLEGMSLINNLLNGKFSIEKNAALEVALDISEILKCCDCQRLASLKASKLNFSQLIIEKPWVEQMMPITVAYFQKI